MSKKPPTDDKEANRVATAAEQWVPIVLAIIFSAALVLAGVVYSIFYLIKLCAPSSATP